MAGIARVHARMVAVETLLRSKLDSRFRRMLRMAIGTCDRVMIVIGRQVVRVYRSTLGIGAHGRIGRRSYAVCLGVAGQTRFGFNRRPFQFRWFFIFGSHPIMGLGKRRFVAMTRCASRLICMFRSEACRIGRRCLLASVAHDAIRAHREFDGDRWRGIVFRCLVFVGNLRAAGDERGQSHHCREHRNRPKPHAPPKQRRFSCTHRISPFTVFQHDVLYYLCWPIGRREEPHGPAPNLASRSGIRHPRRPRQPRSCQPTAPSPSIRQC